MGASEKREVEVQVKGVRGPAGEFGAHGVVEIRQNANRVYDFMKRVEDQPRWNQGVKLSQVIKRISDNTLHIKQVLNWSFMALRGDFSMSLAMHEEPSKMQIRTELLAGSMMRRFSSNVGVQQLGPNTCRLEMQLFMQPSVYVPFGIRHIVGSQVRRQLRGVLEKVKEELDHQPAASVPPQGLFGSLASLGELSSRCEGSPLGNALRSHPLDISVWG